MQKGEMEVKASYQWGHGGEGLFELKWNDTLILAAHAAASHTDGRIIDSRTASLVEKAQNKDGGLTLVYQADNGLILSEHLEIDEKGTPAAYAVLSEENGNEVETCRITPLVIQAGKDNPLRLWKSIWTKMLLVPYDNTMWLRYEAQPLRAGRKSYDLTVLFMDDDREGLLVGAADFDIWKNAVVCSATDARTLDVVSGIADEGTHDSLSHGSVPGKEVASSRFYILYGKDYRALLEQYGDLIADKTQPMEWKEGVPFGFNSWAGLAFRLNADRYQETGRFLREELQPLGYQNQERTYVNLDAGWNVIPEEQLIRLVGELHENGQRAGIYDAPFAFFGKDDKEQIPGVPGHCFQEILLKDPCGNPLPRVDGAIPYDVTHPLWQQYTAWKLERFVRWSFDYIKVDFMSHGGMEGCHYNKLIRTGRQAISLGYQFLDNRLNEQAAGRPFFISLSIAPLFPNGRGHARRFSCDAFGTNEDVEYVLNAQTYAWWQSGRLYHYNDPDHICLLKSFGMERDSTPGEARARYTASAIAGTVMMLSDDYERPQARERTRSFACNRQINQIAASAVSFRPVEAADASACHAFTAVIHGRQCVALFHWKNQTERVELDCRRAGLKPGVSYRELWSGEVWQDKDGTLSWNADGCDAILLQEI